MPISSKTIRIIGAKDKAVARREVLLMARRIGFAEIDSQELCLVASELASNLIQHAGGGDLIIEQATQADLRGIRIESLDRGKGIADPEAAIGDGFSTSSSLGYGLGTVNRLMDELHIQPRSDRKAGCRVVSLRWHRPDSPQQTSFPLDLGGASRPMPGMKLNGDAFFLKTWKQAALVAVIDGVGHGQYAHRASSRARNYIEKHYDQPITNLFLGVARECRITRGVVMAIARFDWEPLKLTFASVGNISTRVFGAKISLPLRRGILGLNAPQPLIIEHKWQPGDIMVLHSDGIASRWGPDDFPGFASLKSTELARQLVRKLARDHDDATVAVVKGAKTKMELDKPYPGT